MARILLIELILFSLPFVIWITYRGLLGRLKQQSGGTFDERPMQLLLIAGGALTLIGMGYFALTSGTRGDTVYVPAHMENGEIVPGRFVPREEAGDLAGMTPRERAQEPE